MNNRHIRTTVNLSRPIALIAAAAVSFTLTACSSGDSGNASDTKETQQTKEQTLSSPKTTVTSTLPPSPAPSHTETSTSSPTESEGTQAPIFMGTPSLDKTQRQPEGDWDLTATGVRVADHDSFTRVVIDLDGTTTPGWFATPTDSPAQQGSGKPVDYQGSFALDLGVNGFDAAIPPTPGKLDVGVIEGAKGGVVKEIQYLGAFEGQGQFVIGLDGEHAYSVSPLADPTRLVIDIKH